MRATTGQGHLTRELSEIHEHQAATSEVLGIISRSPKDAQPVLDAIVQSAARLCGSAFSIVQLYDGEYLHLAAVAAFTALVGGRADDLLASFHLKRLLNGATGTLIAMD